MADTQLGSRPDTGPAEPAAGPVKQQADTPGTGPAEPAATPVAQQTGPPSTGGQDTILRGIGVGLLLLAVFVLGFAGYLYGLSGVQEARSQRVMFTQLQAQLAQVGGIVAPTGPTKPGAPVAILDIPSIGLRDMVVVEGTSPENLMVGPGHRRDTPLPGQPGVSQIYGRRATFGAPFGRIDELRPGDSIQVVTGQGTSVYTVAAVANSTKIIEDPSPNRLLLVTASSPTIPRYFLAVDADLATAVKPSPGVSATVQSPELPMASDDSTLALAMVWALALALTSAAATIAATRWRPWVAYLAAGPVILAVLWNLYQALAALLPNLY